MIAHEAIQIECDENVPTKKSQDGMTPMHRCSSSSSSSSSSEIFDFLSKMHVSTACKERSLLVAAAGSSRQQQQASKQTQQVGGSSSSSSR
jgi:hypothetical protein